jgi:hypothetical protein
VSKRAEQILTEEKTMTPKSILVLLFTALLAIPVVAFQADTKPAEPAPSPEREFQSLLERVKKSDTTVDFAVMRKLQARLPDYKPYGADPDDHPFAELSAGNLDRAKMLADYVLGMNYLDLEAHMAAEAVAEKRGDAAAAAHHHYVVKGVLDSIFKSGDGTSLETAFVVVALSEEYAVMAQLGLQLSGQSLLNDDAGHSYDRLIGVNPKTKAAQEVYFNIDALMGALTKELSD